jgi:acyl-CoA thioester hydrolase
VDQKAAFAGGMGVYAVADLHIRYLRPAQYDDALIVVSRITAIRAASVIMQQALIRPDITVAKERLGDEVLTQATVHAAFLSPDGRPRRQPKDWIEKFRPFLDVSCKPHSGDI